MIVTGPGVPFGGTVARLVPCTLLSTGVAEWFGVSVPIGVAIGSACPPPSLVGAIFAMAVPEAASAAPASRTDTSLEERELTGA